MNACEAGAIDVLGTRVDAINIDMLIDQIRARLPVGGCDYICVVPVHSVMMAHDDECLRKRITAAWRVTPDGMPLVWILRHAGHRHVARVYGPDLMRRICAESTRCGWSHYLYGGTPETLAALEESLRAAYPGINIVGRFAPPFRPLNATEWSRLKENVDACRPDFFWVGIGSPRQEHFMAEQCGKLDTRMMIGVGAAFDYLSGRAMEAPRWMQRTGLQWLHRLCSEPGRLWRRYLVSGPRFVVLLAGERMRRRRHQ